MEVKVKLDNNIYTLHLPSKPTTSQLQNEICKTTQVQPKNQKIILKGKIISNDFKPKQKISKFDIDSGTKLLLIAMGQKDDTPQSKTRNRRQTKTAKSKTTNLENCQDPEIVRKGPPPGCEEGTKTPLPKFPNSPFVVYDSNGVTSHLSIEQEAIWVAQVVEGDQKGNQDRIFISDIADFKFDDIEEYKGRYMMLSLSIGKCENVRDANKKFYFIPCQYTKAFTDFLSANRNDQG